MGFMSAPSPPPPDPELVKQRKAEEERLAMVMNEPRPPTGLIYNEWTASHVIDDFKYNPS